MIHRRSIAASVLAMLMFSGCAGPAVSNAPALAAASAGAPPLDVGEPIPDLVLSELDTGRSLSLGSLRGKVVLLDIWASWCAPCQEEMPLIDDIAKRLRPRGVEVVAVSIDEQRDDAREFLKVRGQWSAFIAHDPEGKVPNALRPPKMPTSYLVDRDGVVRQLNAGFIRGDEGRLETALAELCDSDSARRGMLDPNLAR